MKTPSEEPILRSRLLPRISLRLLLVITFMAAVVAAMARTAQSGAVVTQALLFALTSLLGFFAFSSMLFLISRASDFGRGKHQEISNTGSPFAADQLPPQILPPRNRPS